MKRIVTAVTALAVAFVLAGCTGPSEVTNEQGEVFNKFGWEKTYTVEGKPLKCYGNYEESQAGVMTCDWVGYHGLGDSND